MKLTFRRLALAVTGAGTIIAALTAPDSPSGVVPESARIDPAMHAPVRGNLIAALPGRPGLGKQHGDLFAPESRRPAPAPVSAQAPLAPVPPPNPYRFAGAVSYGGKLRTLITDGNRIYEAKAGEELNGSYLVDSVTPDEVVLVYTPLGSRHPIAARWVFAPSPTPTFATASSGSAPPLPPGSPLIAATADATPSASPFPPGSPLTRPGSASFAGGN